MDSKDNENELKGIQEEKDLIKAPLYLKEEKYLLEVFPSKDKNNIAFKLEKEKIQTYYFFEKFDLKDLRQKNKIFISDKNPQELFNHLKCIIKKFEIRLEKSEMKINIFFKSDEDKKYNFKLFLRKKIVSQDRLNPLLVEQIQENKSKIKTLKNQLIKLDNSLQSKNDIINNINNNITNINNILNNINVNSVNNSNSTKNSSSNEDNSENTSINNSINNNDYEDEEENLNNPNLNLQQKEIYSKRNTGKKKKKNKNIYQKMKNMQYENKNNINDDKTGFFFDLMEIFQNKKVIELLIILNVVTILIVMYILGAIYNLKENLNFDLDKIRDDDYMNKVAYLSFSDDSNDEDSGNYRNFFRENLDSQLKKKEEERITSSKEDFLDDRKRKIQERRKRNSK